MALISKTVTDMDDKEAKARIEHLRREIERHNAAYYLHDAPLISDYDFDRLMLELRGLAAAHGIALKPDIYPTYSSDGTIYWRSGGEARVGLIGPGIASSHAYERTHRDSLHHTNHLIARYLGLGPDDLL